MPSRRARMQIITSRLKALLSITETFNRANIGSLTTAGTTSAKWDSVRGSWGILSSKASSSTAASSYPISTLTFSKEDVTLSLDGISPGVGTAFWVTDSGNWWGTYLDSTQSCQTCSNTSNCASYYSCCQGTMNASNQYSFTYCTGTMNAGTTNPASTTNCPGGYSTVTTCPCGTYNQGNIAGYTVSYGCLPNGVAYGGAGGNAAPSSACGGCSTGLVCRRFSDPYYNTGNCTCPSSQQTCPGGFSVFNYFVYTAGNCNGNYATGYAWNTSYCNSNYASNCCASYNAVTSYPCNCVSNQSIKLIKSISGVISTVANFTLASAAVGIKTILSGNTVTVQAYSSSGYTSQIGANQSTTVSGYTKSKKHGILKAPTTYSADQTSDIDEFRVV